jgi:hypothetical protein
MESSEEWDYWDESGKAKECINGRNNGHVYLLICKQLIIVGAGSKGEGWWGSGNPLTPILTPNLLVLE